MGFRARSGFKCWNCHLLSDPRQLIVNFPNVASHLLQSLNELECVKCLVSCLEQNGSLEMFCLPS